MAVLQKYSMTARFFKDAPEKKRKKDAPAKKSGPGAGRKNAGRYRAAQKNRTFSEFVKTGE